METKCFRVEKFRVQLEKWLIGSDMWWRIKVPVSWCPWIVHENFENFLSYTIWKGFLWVTQVERESFEVEKLTRKMTDLELYMLTNKSNGIMESLDRSWKRRKIENFLNYTTWIRFICVTSGNKSFAGKNDGLEQYMLANKRNGVMESLDCTWSDNLNYMTWSGFLCVILGTIKWKWKALGWRS